MRCVPARSSRARSKSLIFSADAVLPVNSLEPADGKMAASDILEMLNKYVVYDSAAQRADNRDGLRCNLFGHYDSEAGGY